MTSPNLDRITPSKTVHTPPPEKPSVRRLTTKQVGVIGTVITDLILAQVALALGGINVFGVKPFAFLTAWGQQIQVKAADAYNKAMASEAVANSSDANTAIAIGQSYTTQTGLQTTWNNLWEANTNQTASANKTAADVKSTQATVRTNAVQGASGAVVNGQNIQGTWDSIYNGVYNTELTGNDLTAVRTATGAIVYSTNIAGSNSQIAANNIQNTWNTIYTASGGDGSGNRSLADAQYQLGLLNTTAYRADGNVYNTWDEFFRQVYGWKPPNQPTIGDFGGAVGDVADAPGTIIKPFEPLLPRDGGETNSGNSISDTFTNYVTALPNPPWTVSYMYPSQGFGNGTIGVDSSKKIVWSDTGTSKRRGIAIYNATQLTTKYQKVTMTLSGWPQPGASNWLYARSNETGTTGIAARIYVNTFLLFINVSFTVELYSITTSNNVTTYSLLDSTTTSLPKTTSKWMLQCGTTNDPAGLATFRVLCDDTQVISRTAYGTADGGNYVGFGMESSAFILPLIPAGVTAFSAWDNIGAEYLGVGYRAERSTTEGQVVATTTGAMVPSDVFNADSIPATKTLTKVTSSEITVTIAGWYVVTVSLAVSSFNIRPAVLVNNDVFAKGMWDNPSCATFIVYAKAGDTIKPGYQAGANLTIVGEGTGTTTYWSLTFLGNKLPTNPETMSL